MLITLEYGYEAFPSFTAYTHDTQQDRNFSQELRLVSNSKGPLNWIGGLFYYSRNLRKLSEEFTPHYDEFNGFSRPDSLEYISYEEDDLTEKAAFGEIGYDITDKWQVTVGGRWYKYDLSIDSDYDTPLFNTAFGAPPDAITFRHSHDAQSDSGSLYKINTSYHFTNDLMGYVTISEGFSDRRIERHCCVHGGRSRERRPGASARCPTRSSTSPTRRRTTRLGVRSQWLDRRLTFNGALYYIDWKDPQLATLTENGALPIVTNGDGARSKGIELSLSARVTPRMTVGASYSHTTAELSAVAPRCCAGLDAAGLRSDRDS